MKGNFKYSRVMKIPQVQQKLEAKQFSLFCLTCFLFVLHLNFKQLIFSGEPKTQCTHQFHAKIESHGNVKESFAMSCHVQSYQDLEFEPYGSQCKH